MSPSQEMDTTEDSPLLKRSQSNKSSINQSTANNDIDIERGSIFSGSHISIHSDHSEEKLSSAVIGERLPYNDYTTIDWLHDLIKDSYRMRQLHQNRGLWNRFLALTDGISGWLAAAIIGILTACIAFFVDICVATLADWKTGYCSSNLLLGKDGCCPRTSLLPNPPSSSSLWYRSSSHGTLDEQDPGEECKAWIPWTDNYAKSFALYVGLALLFGVISGVVTLFSKQTLPSAVSDDDENSSFHLVQHRDDISSIPAKSQSKASLKPGGKTMYMAAGSGIPEIKTVLSGFVIPHLLDLRVLIIKAVGSTFAVSTGMCLGKEGPFVHISTCVAYIVAMWFPKYKHNGKKLREMLSAGCASGLSVAFGAPIGGVLFSYEEISTYFPRKVLWRAFLCSLCAAITLKQLNPTGTGKLVLFETNYGTSYQPYHYLVFVLLGVAGGMFGGVFCKCNFYWSRTFRSISIIKNHPVLEVALIVLATALLQYPHPITRDPGDIIIKNLLVDCKERSSAQAWVCTHERAGGSSMYLMSLAYGTLVKLFLTTITFGIKVPSGIIIPALDAGAFFGRLVGQAFADQISPGIFAMVGGVAFLAGISRMTISLAVIMLELTGELEYVVPYMVGILVAKWVADALEPSGVYDLAQTVLGHPFLDGDHALKIAQQSGALVAELVPPSRTMEEITVEVTNAGFAAETVLIDKLELLKRRGLMDAGLVLVRQGLLVGYLNQAELEGGLQGVKQSPSHQSQARMVNLIGKYDDNDADVNFNPFVDRTPIAIAASAPVEFAVEMFSKLGLRYLCVLEDGTGKLQGVIIKKRLLDWLHREKEA